MTTASLCAKIWQREAENVCIAILSIRMACCCGCCCFIVFSHHFVYYACCSCSFCIFFIAIQHIFLCHLIFKTALNEACQPSLSSSSTLPSSLTSSASSLLVLLLVVIITSCYGIFCALLLQFLFYYFLRFAQKL